MNLIRRKSLALLLFTSLASWNVFGQEALGLVMGPRSGLQSIQLNPAHFLGQNMKWEAQILGGLGYLSTNYVSIHKSSIWKLSRQSLVHDQMVQNAHTWAYDYSNIRKYGSARAMITGPSFIFREQHWALGIFTNWKTQAYTGMLPKGFNQASFHSGMDSISIPKSSLATAMYSELGLHFSTSIANHQIGVNIKYLRPQFGALISALGQFDVYNINSDTMSILGSSELAYTNVLSSPIQSHGYGWAIDIGWNKAIGPWQIGLSIIDLGFVRFNDVRSNLRYTSLPEPSFWITNVFDDATTVNEYINALELAFQENGTDLGNRLDIGLASAVSGQMSYQWSEEISLFAGGYFPIRVFNNSMQRDNIQWLALNYQHKWIGHFLSTSLLNYQNFHIGYRLQLGPLQIGTDDILVWIGRKKIRHADFYFKLALSNFKLELKRKKNAKIECYTF